MNRSFAKTILTIGALAVAANPALAARAATNHERSSGSSHFPAGGKPPQVLYAFPNGSMPQAGLVRDKHGNLYGTTTYGGTYNYGTAFKLLPEGTAKTLFSFSQDSGSLPYGGLIEDGAGNFYGTTTSDGAYGGGVVFQLTSKGKETILHSFDHNGTDGYGPFAGVIMDGSGNLFGTTIYGGTSGAGTVYKVSADGSETVLYSFSGSDGANPVAGLVEDQSGNLYGTTLNGGADNLGTAFELAPDGTETVLHSFNEDDGFGSQPYAGFIRDDSGNLFGATSLSVFEISSNGAQTVLHYFNGQKGDGSGLRAGVIEDASGNLYGTTIGGGALDFGTVFKITPDRTETILSSFNKKKSGGFPLAGLVSDGKGNLYGTTSKGGHYGGGTVFEVDK